MTTTTTEPDTTKLSKIRALLDKAESTAATFPEEAEALTNKAIELMERYRINEAMIADAAPVQDRGKIIETSFNIGSGPYVGARTLLVNQIATEHSVMQLQGTTYTGRMVYLNGYETDVALTEMLYTSLLVQATRSMQKAGKQKPKGVHGTAYNRAFLMGFANRIGERLREANKSAKKETPTESGRSVALVLADRTKDVQDSVYRRYGKLRSARPASAPASITGNNLGREAANKADISSDRRVSANNNRALGR